MKKPKKKQPEQPEIYAIRKDNSGTTFSRKEFLGTVGALGAAMALNPLNSMAEKIEAKGSGLSQFKAHDSEVHSVVFSPDGKILASGSSDKTIKIWSIPEGKLIKTLKGHTEAVNSLCFNQSGKILISGSADNLIKVWALPEGKLLQSMDGHTKPVNAVAISPDDKILASGSDDMTIRLWSLPDGKLLKTLDKHKKSVKTVCFSPYGKILASGSEDGIMVWSIPEGQILKTLTDSSSSVRNVIFSPDAKILAAGNKQAGIDLWSVPEYKRNRLTPSLSINSISFSPDGNTLISCSSTNIELRSSPAGKSITTFSGHSNTIMTVSSSPDGFYIASGSTDGNIRIWQMPNGNPCFILFDPEITEKTDAINVKQMGNKTLTLPCGSPIPAGASCICDCVSSSRTYPGSETVCTCNTITLPAGSTLSGNMICVCNTIVVGRYVVPTYYYYTTYTSYWYPN